MQNLNSMDLVREKKDLFRVQIRRQKNDEFFTCKRQRSSVPFFIQKEDLEKMMNDFQENLNFKQIERCVYYLSLIRRSMLSTENKEQAFENMNYFIQRNLIENLLQIISIENYLEYEKLIEEASWCMSNLAGGSRDHVKEILKRNCINYMKNLFCKAQTLAIIDNVILFFCFN